MQDDQKSQGFKASQDRISVLQKWGIVLKNPERTVNLFQQKISLPVNSFKHSKTF